MNMAAVGKNTGAVANGPAPVSISLTAVAFLLVAVSKNATAVVFAPPQFIFLPTAVGILLTAVGFGRGEGGGTPPPPPYTPPPLGYDKQQYGQCHSCWYMYWHSGV